MYLIMPLKQINFHLFRNQMYYFLLFKDIISENWMENFNSRLSFTHFFFCFFLIWFKAAEGRDGIKILFIGIWYTCELAIDITKP